MFQPTVTIQDIGTFLNSRIKRRHLAMCLEVFMLRVALVSVLMLTGCAQMLDPGDEALPPSNLPVEFQSPPAQTPFSVETGAGFIVVQDRTVTGVCHKRENRGAYLEGSTVTLWIAHTGWPGGDACPAIGKVGAYRATIQGLQAGTYLLRVQYIRDIDTDTYPRPNLEQQVTVR